MIVHDGRIRSARLFPASLSAREKAIRQLHVTFCAQARAGIDARCGLVPRLRNIDLAYTYGIILVSRGRVHAHVSLQVKVVSASRLRAHTYAHTHSHSKTADEQMSTTCALQPKAAMRTSHAGTVPLAPSLPVNPPAVLGAHTTRAAPVLPPGQPGRLGRQGCPFPPIMGNIGSAYSGGPTGQSHILGRYFAWPLFASCLCADGPDRLLSSSSLLQSRKSPPPPDVVEGPASDNIPM